MKLFFKGFDDSGKNKRFYYRIFNMGKNVFNSWTFRHTKILKHAGSGGKNHSLEKGHVFWNRKGRW